MKRYRDALAIQAGACNPSGVARALVAAIDEARAENPSTDAIREDSACRLICHQLAFLFGMHVSPDWYSEATRECEIKRERGESAAP